MSDTPAYDALVAHHQIQQRTAHRAEQITQGGDNDRLAMCRPQHLLQARGSTLDDDGAGTGVFQTLLQLLGGLDVADAGSLSMVMSPYQRQRFGVVVRRPR